MNALPSPISDNSYHHISEAEYLANYAQHPDIRYELIDGKVHAMAGSSVAHNDISLNLAGMLRQHLRANASHCKAFMSDIRVNIEKGYYYPDVLVDCTEQRSDNYQAQTPTLIIEVLSPSTSFKDRTIKLEAYKKIATLQEYALVEQDFMQVTIYRRKDNWKATTYTTAFGNVENVLFESVGLTVSLAEIYADVVIKYGKLSLHS